MKTKTIITIVILFLITLVSATYYSGDTIEIPLDFEIVNCSVINSTYNLDGLNLSWYENNIVISTSPYYLSDNLTISCWVIKYGEVIEEHYSSGGSCSYNKNYDWNCSEWSDCVNLIQTRTCKKYNNCGNTYGKPNLNQSCINIESNETCGDVCPINLTEIINQEPEKENWISKYIWFILAGIFTIIFIVISIIEKRLKKKVKKDDKRSS